MQITAKYLEELQNSDKRLASHIAAVNHSELNADACAEAVALGDLTLATRAANLRDAWAAVARALED